jgi:Peptidase family C25
VGHSAPAAWSREGLITANQVSAGLFNPTSNSFAVVQIGCWGAYFVEPTSSTVAHAMLLGEKGAVAVIGTTALTDTLTDTALFNALIPRLGVEQFGAALRASMDSMPANATGAKVGAVLLGDPALK